MGVITMEQSSRGGQSVLEYTLLLGVVITIIVAAMVARGGTIRSGVERAYDRAGDAIGNAAMDITNTVFH